MFSVARSESILCSNCLSKPPMSTFLTSPPFSTTELSICLQNSLWASSLGKLQVTKVLPLSLCCTQFCPENFFIYQDLIINHPKNYNSKDKISDS